MASLARPQVSDDAPVSLRVEALRGAQIASFEEGWRALAREASQPNPFFEQWCLEPALASFDPANSVVLLCAFEDDRLVGLLPVRQSGDYYGYPVPHFSVWLHANAFCGAPLVRSGYETAFWAALLAWADDASPLAMFLHLAGLPRDGVLYEALREVVADQARPAGVVMREERALLASDLSPETYFEASLSGKKRKELRRQAKRLGEEGALAFSRQNDDGAIGQWIHEFLRLEAAGWKGAEGSALASSEDTAGFFRAALSGAAAQGRLERLSLTLDGAPIAMLANFVTPPGTFSFKTAYDERYARYSPGVLLQRENLDLLDRADIAWCDSCAAADHPMIERIWREKRTVVRASIALGGPIRRQAARAFIAAETKSTRKDL